MQYSLIVPALMAASAVAAPAVHYVQQVKHVTVYVHEGAAAAPTPAPQAVQAPAPQIVYPVAPQDPKPSAPKPSTPKPEAPSSDDSPSADSASMLAVFNKWRKAFGNPECEWDDALAENARQTGENGGGVKQEHMLPSITSGACGQIITPGRDTPLMPPSENAYGDWTNAFEVSLLSWYCEAPNESATSAICPTIKSINAMQYIDTAHYDELVNPAYTKVGCAFARNPNAVDNAQWNGLWTCTLQT